MTIIPMPSPRLRIREEVVREALAKVAREAPPGRRFGVVGFWNGADTELRLLYRNVLPVGPAWQVGAVVGHKPGQSWDFGVSGQLFF